MSMSSGILLLAGLFATGPMNETPMATAPMPRAKAPRFELEFRVDVTPRGVAIGAGVHPASQPLRLEVPKPSPTGGPPPEVHAMMLQALNHMAGPVEPPQVCLLPLAAATPVSTSPSPDVLPLGFWHRDVGPIRYTVEFKERTLTVTTSVSETLRNGRTATIDHVLTADWFPTRTPGELVGLITSYDCKRSGAELPLDAMPGVLSTLVDVQRQVNGKPIALKFRTAVDSLTLSDVRLPQLKDVADLALAFEATGGVYKSAVVYAQVHQVGAVSPYIASPTLTRGANIRPELTPPPPFPLLREPVTLPPRYVPPPQPLPR